MPSPDAEWEEDCLRWRGEVLTGKYSHWCWEWDGLLIDETCGERPCGCEEDLKKEVEEEN